MKYTVITGTSNEELSEYVDRKLQEGWELLGGVSVQYDGTMWYFFQAMTDGPPTSDV